MSDSRGGHFPGGNQDEDLSSASDEPRSSRESSVYSKSNSANSSPRLEPSSYTTTRTSVSSSSSISSLESNCCELAHFDVDVHKISTDSSSTSATPDSELRDNWGSQPAPVEHSQSLSSTSTNGSGELQNRTEESQSSNITSVNSEAPEIKTSSGLLVRSFHSRVSHSSRHNHSRATPRKNKGFLSRMYTFSVKYYKEICIVLFVIATGLPFLRSKPLKTRAVQTPEPFFPPHIYGNLIEDHFQGEYVDLVNHKIPRGPSFVMYYAPWDSESLAAKSVFLEVVRHFKNTRGNQIKFYSVNCWWPDGQCRQNYKNLSHFPIFVAHIHGAAGIIYNGPVRAELMIRFLNLILQPVTRIDNEDELWRFRAQHDACTLAYFNFSVPESASSYDIYLHMALRNLEADPLGQIGYGVFLQRSLAEKYFVTSSNAISLVLFNEIHTAKWHGSFSAQDMRAPIKQVSDWVMERTKITPITWAYRVRNGFSNRPVTLGPLDLAEEMSRKPVVLLITRRYYPSAYSPFYAQFKEVALDYFNCNKSGNVTKLRRYVHKINSEWLKLWKSIQSVCKTMGNASSSCTIMKEQLSHWKSSELLLSREPLAKFENVSASIRFTGSSCRSHQSFRFIAIDPADVPHFIDLALGGVSRAAGSLTEQEPLAYIIDGQRNLLLPITSFRISDISLAIHNYIMSTSRAVLPPGVNEENKRTLPLHATKLWVERQTISTVANRPIIEKINVEDYLNMMEGSGNFEGNDIPFLIMYTAKFCGYCGVALAQFVALARFLQEYDLSVRLARIDVFRNSLPSYLTVGEIPSFLFFPAKNRSDVRIFPSGEVITTQNLLKFLLSELDPKTRIDVSLQSPLCAAEYFDEDATTIDGTNSTSPEPLTNSRNSSKKSKRVPTVYLGPENCQRINRKLVSQQIASTLEILKRGEDVQSCNTGSRKQLKFNLSEIPGLPNSNNYYSHSSYFNGDRMRFVQEVHNDCFQLSEDLMPEFFNPNQASSSDGFNDDSNSNNTSGSQNTKADQKKTSVVMSETVHAWSYQLLDHLRSMRLFLDTV